MEPEWAHSEQEVNVRYRISNEELKTAELCAKPSGPQQEGTSSALSISETADQFVPTTP